MPSAELVELLGSQGWAWLYSQTFLLRLRTQLRHMWAPLLTAAPFPPPPQVRVGLRPYCLGGSPLIGPVSALPGAYLAAGHEGSGLCMGPSSAELLVTMLLQEDLQPSKRSWGLDAAAFLPDEGRKRAELLAL